MHVAFDEPTFVISCGHRAWQSLSAQLDQLPVFTVANAEGQPLQYEIDGKPKALFYADIEAAKKELEAAQGMYPDIGCDLIPVGVGSAYKLSCEGKAELLPSVATLRCAALFHSHVSTLTGRC